MGRGVRIASAGTDKPPAMAAATRTLVEPGHRKIVLLTRQIWRLPQPGAAEQAFLDTLSSYGIPPSRYHLPHWEKSVEGFHARLEALFRFTPPTALIIDEVPFFVAVQQFFAGRTIRIPNEVSLICTDASPDFDWCRPTVAHIRWDSRRVVRRADNLSRGKKDLRQTLTPAEFVEGGTIGPANEE